MFTVSRILRLNHKLYNLSIETLPLGASRVNNVVLKAKLTPGAGKHINMDTEVGDDSFNLSAMIGNVDGEFKWGSGGFEQSAQNIKLDDKSPPGQRRLLADLQSLRGTFVSDRSINLDDYIDLIEYVHPREKEIHHKLAPKVPAPPPRSIVLCFDGTSNHFSNQNTNVVKLVELLKKNDPDRQQIYYQTGVGTYAPPGLITNVGLSVATTLDKGFATFLYQHVIDGYKYLMDTYRVGDRISIFGFSRGAFTARALAGMIHCVGLLPKHNVEHVSFAYEVYKNATERKHNAGEVEDESSECKAAGALHCDVNDSAKAKNVHPEDFKQTFCRPVSIDFVGVWDTVASVGSLWPTTLPYINYNPSIRNFRQALSLDERRANFIPSVWDHSQTEPKTQTANEVWFKGGHTDVGGGAPPQPGRGHSMLSNIALRWMIRQCFSVDTGIILDHRTLAKYRESGVLAQRPPQRKDESDNDYKDRLLALSAELDKVDIENKMYDAMKDRPIWNLLEFLTSSKPTQTPTGLSSTRWPNLYKPRAVYAPKELERVSLHTSVVEHLKNKDCTYRPRATWHGYSTTNLPAIEDEVGSNDIWPDEAAEAMKGNWRDIDSEEQWGLVGWLKGLFRGK